MNASSNWDDAEVIGGVDLREKATLLGVEFLITGVRFEKNKRNVEYAYVTAETRDGITFEFNDSSQTGVRAQLSAFLERKGKVIDYDSGEIHDTKIYVPRGLRVSEFEVRDERGRTKMARVHYLTSQS